MKRGRAVAAPAAVVSSMALAVVVVGFHNKEGSTIVARHPPSAPLPTSDEELAECAIPEGAHQHDEDHTYLIRREASGEVVYGCVAFHCRRDPSDPRGAVMRYLTTSKFMRNNLSVKTPDALRLC